MKMGNWSGSPTPIYDPATGNLDTSGRTSFAGNIIPSNRFDKASRKMVEMVAVSRRLANIQAPGPGCPPNHLGSGGWG
jgi:hypothetical protein